MEKIHTKPNSLPAINNTSHGFGESSSVSVRPETLSKMESLEDRISYQERTTRSMIERALMVKEDMIESLNKAQISFQGEKTARALLQEHVRTITLVVKRLSREIEILEEEIRTKKSQIEGQSRAFKSLELHNMAGLTDLRSRVARCDTAIERLSADARNSSQSLHDQRLKLESTIKEVNARVQALEINIQDILRILEKQNMEQTDNIQKFKGQANKQLTNLDAKTNSIAEEMKGNFAASQKWTETEYVKLTQDLQAKIDRLESIMQERHEKLEKRVETYLKKVDQMLTEERDRCHNLLDQRFKIYQSEQEKALEKSLSHLRNEYKQGFNTVHETMSSLQKVLTGKLVMVENDLRKAINNVVKMVVAS